MKIKNLFLFFVLTLALTLPVTAQVTPASTVTLSNLPTVITGQGSSNITTHTIALRQNQGFSVLPYFVGNAATAVSNLTLTFKVSVDGTNWNTTADTALTYAVPGNGSTAVRGYKLFPPTTVNNVAYFTLSNITNSCLAGTNFTITNIVISVGN